MMERSSERVASRALRRMGLLVGALAAAVPFKKELRNFPAHVRSSVGGRTIYRQLKDLLESTIILVNPETTWSP